MPPGASNEACATRGGDSKGIHVRVGAQDENLVTRGAGDGHCAHDCGVSAYVCMRVYARARVLLVFQF